MLSKKFSEAGKSFAKGNRAMDYDDDDEDGDATPRNEGRYRNSRRKSLQKRNRMFEIVQRDMRQKDLRLKQRKIAINAGQRQTDDELYIDRDRAAGVSYGKRYKLI